MIFSKAVLSAKTAVLDDKRQKCSVEKWIVVLQQKIFAMKWKNYGNAHYLTNHQKYYLLKLL